MKKRLKSMKENQIKNSTKIELTPKQRKKLIEDKEDHFSRNSYLFIVFSELLLESFLKKGIIKIDENTVPMLVPWIPLLDRCLISNRDEVVFHSMKILSKLMKSNLLDFSD